MKKITKLGILLAAFLAWGNVAQAQTTMDFEDATVIDNWYVFQNGPGATDVDANMTIAANPSTTGINTSANSLMFVEDLTAALWGGCFTDYEAPVTFTAENCIVKVMVYKDVISNFGVKFELSGVALKEILLPNTKTNEWEEMTFDFTSEIGKPFARIVLLPDFPAARTAGSTTYVDNISFNAQGGVVEPPVATGVAMDFEDATVLDNWYVFQNGPDKSDVDANMTIAANPSTTGINTSANSLMFVEDLTAAPWGGCFTDLDAPVTITAENAIVTVMVYKDVISNFGVKFELNGAAVKEILLPNTKTNEWELLTYDFTSEIGKEYARLVLLPDFSDPRTAGSTTYIDNIIVPQPAGTAVKGVRSAPVIACFPNPTTNQITVTAESAISKVVVSNLVGQSIKTVSAQCSEARVDLSELAAGNYFVTVKLASGQVSTQKIVKL